MTISAHTHTLPGQRAGHGAHVARRRRAVPGPDAGPLLRLWLALKARLAD